MLGTDRAPYYTWAGFPHCSLGVEGAGPRT